MRTLQPEPDLADATADRVAISAEQLPRESFGARVRALVRAIPTPILCFAYVLLLIGAAIGVDRAIATRVFAQPGTFVPAYRSFQDYDVGVKMQQFRGVANQRFDAFFIGNSRTMFGVNPAVFDAALAREGTRFHSYNLAEESVDVQFWQPFFTQYYRRKLPHYVFLGLLPRDLDAGYAAHGAIYESAFFRSAGFQNRNMSALNRSMEEELTKLYILHGRVSDLKLVTLSDILHGRKLNLDPAHLANNQGWMQLPAQVLATSKSLLSSERARLATRHGNLPFQLGRVEALRLAQLNSLVQAGGGCLITYTTPLLYDREQWGTVEMRRGFDATMRRLVKVDPGLQFVDVGGNVQAGYGVRDYGDGDHLNGRGATRFSGQLASALHAAMASSVCSNQGARGARSASEAPNGSLTPAQLQAALRRPLVSRP